MTNRREFLGGTVAASLVVGLGYQSGVSASTRGAPVIPLYRSIFDSRYAESRRYAEAAARLGVATHAITGDITDLWFNDLDAAWRDRQCAVAGLTTESALFCLEQLARDHRMRVVFRAEHAFLASGCVEHAVSCSRDALDRARSAGAAGRNWPATMALAHSTLPVTRLASASATLTTPGVRAEEDVAFLVSWVIAPTART